MIKPTTGERIRYFRHKLELTQKQLAGRCGLSESTIRNYELGNRIPSYENVNTIAEALGVSYFTLADEDIFTPEGALHVLFKMSKIYNMVPEIEGDNVSLRFLSEFTPSKSDKPDMGYELKDLVKKWLIVHEKYEAGKIDEALYVTWQSKFPVTT